MSVHLANRHGTWQAHRSYSVRRHCTNPRIVYRTSKGSNWIQSSIGSSVFFHDRVFPRVSFGRAFFHLSSSCAENPVPWLAELLNFFNRSGLDQPQAVRCVTAMRRMRCVKSTLSDKPRRISRPRCAFDPGFILDLEHVLFCVLCSEHLDFQSHSDPAISSDPPRSNPTTTPHYSCLSLRLYLYRC